MVSKHQRNDCIVTLRKLTLFILALFLVTIGQAAAQEDAEKPAAPYLTDLDEAKKLAADREQKILVDFWRPG
jgi:hypothetical protein